MVSKTTSIRHLAKTAMLCLAMIGLTNCDELQPELPETKDDLVVQDQQTNGTPTNTRTFEAQYAEEPDSTSNGVINDDIMDPLKEGKLPKKEATNNLDIRTLNQ